MIDIKKNGLKFKSRETERFYTYEGKLATVPIIDFLKKHGKSVYGNLLDIGCGSKLYQTLFPFVRTYTGVDITSDDADIIGDVVCLPFKSESFDVIVCNQMIEHIPEPENTIFEIHRVLNKGGTLILSAPQMGRLHGEPNDYYRFTKWGIKYLLEKYSMKIEIIEPHGGIFRAFGSHINFFIISKFNNGLLRFFMRVVVISLINLLCPVIDRLIYWDKDTLGYNVLSRRIL